MSTRLDPEDFGAVIRSYQSCVAATITRFDGFIARYVGDGVLIYFGYPRAHEDDAERAVRAALAIIAEIGQTPALSECVRVRIGIATGLVVVGEPIGTGEFAAADSDWRDAKSRRPSASHGRTKHRRHCLRDAPAGW